MPTPILATKLYVPPLAPNLVARPRLVARLNEGVQGKLTLVSAPAGFGKSTLVSAWLAACALPAAWLSLDNGDSQPVRFLAYFVCALQSLAQESGPSAAHGLAPDVGASVLTALQSPQPPPLSWLLTELINEIVAGSADRSAASAASFVVVLDDYHLIDAQPVDEALTFLLDHLPPQMHLVLTTREDPNLPLARYRARGQLTEVRAADLRFTLSEAAAFLNQSMGLTLPAEAISALESRTEGWAAGLQLAALSLQGHGGPHQVDLKDFLQSFSGSHRFVLDYLLEEVLQRQSQRVQDFLLYTSILDRLCGPLCDALLLSTSESGQQSLEALEQANLFIVPLDSERRWYRYHHLFADLLRQQLQRRMALPTTALPTEGEETPIAELHRRASHWYAENELTIEALQHAEAAKDYERMADLLESTWRTMNRSYQSRTLLDWMKRLPDKMFVKRPVLCVGYAWALLSCGELEAGETWLQEAERWLKAADAPSEQSAALSAEVRAQGKIIVDEAQLRALPSSIAAARAYRVQALGDAAGSVVFARLARDLVPEDDHFERGVAETLLGLAYWAHGELESAGRTFAAGLEKMRVAGNLLAAISGTFVLVGIKMAQGRLREAVSIYENALRLAAEQTEPLLRGAGDLYAGLSELQREQGDLEAAAASLSAGKALGEEARLPEMQYRSRAVVTARVKEAQGDLDSALQLLEKAERLYVRGPVPDVRPVSALKARIWITQGRLVEAQEWTRARGLSPDDDLSYLREFEHITLARLLLAQYRHSRADDAIHTAMALLERLLAAAAAGERKGSMIEILMLQALAHDAQGDMNSARAPLARALALAEPEGYVRLFVDEGAPLAHLLSAVARQKGLPDYGMKLLTRLSHDLQARADADSQSPLPTVQPLVEPLSARELEVLQLLAQGLSNRQIGERLFIALDTVKGHNRRIYGKLAVKRRTEAIARARELGLL